VTTQAEWRRQFPDGAYDRSPETLERVGAYCLQDVRTEIALSDAIGPLTPYERRVWELDQRINQRGLRIDIGYVHACLDIVAQASKPLAAEFDALTGGLAVAQTAKLLAWCNSQGFEIDSLAKDNLKALGITGLAEDQEEDDDGPDMEASELQGARPVPESVRRVLEIRAVLGSASIAKLSRMLACVNSDGRVRYTQQYHGAGTGRTAGRLLQPTNFPRGKIEGGHDPAQLVSAIFTRSADFVADLYGDPIAAVASGLRHALISADGHEFNTGDFAGIEARVVLALAGQHDKTAMMVAGDVYLDMAEAIYNRPKGSLNKHDHVPERQIGKNTVLGCGFGMGWAKFKARYCPDQPDEFAQGVIRTYREVWAPMVPKLWKALEAAALAAMQLQGRAEAYGIVYQWHPHALACHLPDGQIMWYRDARTCVRSMPWDVNDRRPGWSYKATKTGQWKTIYAYGGLLCENVVQKIARGFLVEACERLEAAHKPLVLTVYDECMSEIPLAHSGYLLYEQIMAEPTRYSQEIKVPISVEGWAGTRYKK
jgi:DNA polymerase